MLQLPTKPLKKLWNCFKTNKTTKETLQLHTDNQNYDSIRQLDVIFILLKAEIFTVLMLLADWLQLRFWFIKRCKLSINQFVISGLPETWITLYTL